MKITISDLCILWILEHLQQWNKKLNIDTKLKKFSSNSGAIIRIKVLRVNSL